MPPPTSEFFPLGTDLALFVKANKMRLANKSLIYIIKANVKADNQVYKIGKSSNGAARLTSYVHTHGYVKKGSPQAGAKLIYYEVVPGRAPGVAGAPLIARREKALAVAVLQAGGKPASGRGRERYRLTPSQLKAAVMSIPDVWQEWNADYHEALVRQQPPREATTRGCECEKVVTRKRGQKCPTVTCAAKMKFVTSKEPDGQPFRKPAPSRPRFSDGDNVIVRYEDGKDYKAKVTRVTQTEIDVLFNANGRRKQIATIPKGKWWLVKRAK